MYVSGAHSTVEEWVAPDGETGSQESGRQLRLGTGTAFQSYPERADEPDCIHYLRTGVCGYGNRCRFNHPRRPSSTGLRPVRSRGDEYPERIGRPVCEHYMRTGTCKYGATCKYHHPKHGSSGPVTMNINGYPLRLGEKECSYYVKTGQCKFGATCKFHHPQPSGIPTLLDAPTAWPVPPQSSQQYRAVSQPAILPASYIPGNYGAMLFSPGVVHFPGWTPYPAVVAAAVPPSSGTTSPGTLPIFGAVPSKAEWISPWTNFMPTPMGLPLPPTAAQTYSYYVQNGASEMKTAMSSSSSASSIADVPVAPYPDKPSSDMRPELLTENCEDH